jgi:hypothetical protein
MADDDADTWRKQYTVKNVLSALVEIVVVGHVRLGSHSAA